MEFLIDKLSSTRCDMLKKMMSWTVHIILYLANMLTRRIGFSMFEEQPPDLNDVLQLLSLSEEDIAPMLAEVQEKVQATAGDI